MDDITRKRLEAERAAMSATANQVSDNLSSVSSSAPPFDLHDAELRRLGLPEGCDLKMAPFLIGFPAGVMLNWLTVDLCMAIFDAVSGDSQDLLAESYDHTSERDGAIADRLEEIYDLLDEHRKEHIGLTDVFMWARLVRNGVAEIWCAIEEHYESIPGDAYEQKSGEEIRELAVTVSRFMFGTYTSMIREQQNNTSPTTAS